MAIVTRQGTTGRSLSEFITLIGQRYRNVFGANFDLGAETVQGQEIGILAQLFYEADQALVAQSNAQSRDRAIGTQLDDFFSLKDIPRLEARRTTVTATITGSSGRIIPALSKVRTTNGDSFRTTTATTLGTNGMATNVQFESVTTGPIPAPTGDQSIVDNSAWTSVTFNANANIGRNVEEDEIYRLRGGLIEQNNAIATVESIRTALLLTEGVNTANVYENDSAIAIQPGESRYRGISIDPHSTLAIVDGGTDALVGSTIANRKVGGMPTSGARTRIIATLEGADGTFVPASTRATLVMTNGSTHEFRSTEDVMIPEHLPDGNTGTTLCEFEALEYSTIDIPAIPNRWTHSISNIQSVTNTASVTQSNVTQVSVTMTAGSSQATVAADATISITIDGTLYTFTNTDTSPTTIEANGSATLTFQYSGSVNVPALGYWDITPIGGWTGVSAPSGINVGDDDTATTFNANLTGTVGTFIPKGSRIHFRASGTSNDHIFRTTANHVIGATGVMAKSRSRQHRK